MQNNIIIAEIILYFIYYIVMGLATLLTYKDLHNTNNCYKILNLLVFLGWPVLIGYYLLKCIFYWIPKYIIHEIVSK